MTRVQLVPDVDWTWGGPRGIRITLRLTPEQALDQVVAGLVHRRRFRLKSRTAGAARLALGGPLAFVFGEFGLLLQLIPRRLRAGHLGLVWENVDVVAEPGADPSHSVVWLRPDLGSDHQVCVVLGDDLEPVAAALAASGHLVGVGAWEKVDYKAVILSARAEKRAAKARRGR